ncbi:MAG: hypothetical protein ACI9BK_001541 [Acidimicrobiales bacterium]|jgi:hypothetical protein
MGHDARIGAARGRWYSWPNLPDWGNWLPATLFWLCAEGLVDKFVVPPQTPVDNQSL